MKVETKLIEYPQTCNINLLIIRVIQKRLIELKLTKF